VQWALDHPGADVPRLTKPWLRRTSKATGDLVDEEAVEIEPVTHSPFPFLFSKLISSQLCLANNPMQERRLTRGELEAWFNEQFVHVPPVPPELLFNVDETYVCPGKKRKRVVFYNGSEIRRRGVVKLQKHLEHVTLVACISAAGGHLPPSVIISNSTAAMSDATPIQGYTLSGSKKGWMNRKLFEAWVDNVFVPYVNEIRTKLGQPTAPAVLVTDGHNSRESAAALGKLRAQNVTVIVLPAHSSHILQPLDRTVFGALKDHLLNKLDFEGADDAASKRAKLLEALSSAFYHAVEPGTIRSGWRISGLSLSIRRQFCQMRPLLFSSQSPQLARPLALASTFLGE
jgi:hypothetical protein